MPKLVAACDGPAWVIHVGSEALKIAAFKNFRIALLLRSAAARVRNIGKPRGARLQPVAVLSLNPCGHAPPPSRYPQPDGIR